MLYTHTRRVARIKKKYYLFWNFYWTTAFNIYNK